LRDPPASIFRVSGCSARVSYGGGHAGPGHDTGTGPPGVPLRGPVTPAAPSSRRDLPPDWTGSPPGLPGARWMSPAKVIEPRRSGTDLETGPGILRPGSLRRVQRARPMTANPVRMEVRQTEAGGGHAMPAVRYADS